MSKLDKGSSLLLTKAAPWDYTRMRNEQVLTCALCHSFQICQFSGFKQTLFELIWSAANPGPPDVNHTLLHHAHLLWSRYFIFRPQLTDNWTNLQAVPAVPQLLIYPQVEETEFYSYRKLRLGGEHPVCCISTFTDVPPGFQWEVALPHHLWFCCDHTLMHPVLKIRIEHKQKFLQQEADQEVITQLPSVQTRHNK